MTTKTFAELGLSPKLLAAIEASGYTTPTPIQADGIPVAISGRDILGIAQTGTGKTAAFTIPMISRLETGRARARMPRSLILAPTRELAAQVAQSFEKYGVNHKLNVALLIGGVSMDDQVKKLDRGVDVLIATPGRLLDHFQRGRIMLMGVEILVIDEADRMLDMGFIPDIEKICRLLPPRRQTLFFSATMPPEITRLADQFLKDPVRIEVAKPATTAKTITQRFHYCANGEDWAKREALRELIHQEANFKNAIIFCNRKRDVAILLKSLLKHGFNAGALHGDMDQKSRMETLDKFRSGEIKILAASDVAARGLDIPDVSHIFNFDLPGQSDDYVHRIGRTGRAGKLGTAYSLVSPEDLKQVAAIAKITGDTPVWIGDEPTEDDYANAGRRRRGRVSRGGERTSDRGRGASSSRGERGERGDRRDRSPRGERGERALGSDSRPERSRVNDALEVSPADDGQPMLGADASVEMLPGMGEQPDIGQGLPDHDHDEAATTATDGEGTRRRRRRGGRGRGRPRDDAEAPNAAPRDEAAGAFAPRDRHSGGPSSHATEPRSAAPHRADNATTVASDRPRQSPERQPDRRPERSQQRNHERHAEQHGERRSERPGSRGESRGAARAGRESEQRHGAPQGFAENVPAFLRRPLPKRQKVTSE